MPAITKRFVDTASQGRHYDDKLTGFGLYVGKSGTKSYYLEYRPGRGRKVSIRRITIGRHGAPWTPSQARDKALELLAAVKAGNDPLDARDARTSRTVADVIEEWLRRDQAKNRSAREVERIMNRDVLPAWGKRPIEEIRKRDVIALIDGIADRAPIMANRTLAHIKRMLKWAASRDIIENDPAAHVVKVAPEVKRDRVLTDDELVSVWQASEETGYPFGSAVQMLILTGARREEIFSLSWPEFDDDAIRLPAERSKVKEARTIPLSPQSLALLRSLPRFDDGDVVFSFTGKTRFDNVGRAKPRLDKAIAAARGEPLPPWRLHDIRRTVATGLQRLGVRLEVIETVLGHVSGSRAGVVGTYQRHRFEDEAKAAIVAWGEHVGAITRNSSARVLPFPKS
ncbi:MAG: tyrosine-type recombinase/integrase [Geminicoccaceae bacterium]